MPPEVTIRLATHEADVKPSLALGDYANHEAQSSQIDPWVFAPSSDGPGLRAAPQHHCSARVDDAESLPLDHVILNMVDPKPTRADAALIEAAITRFPVIETVMMRRNAYKEIDQKGLLDAIAREKLTDPNPLIRPHVRHVVEALEEATDILAA